VTSGRSENRQTLMAGDLFPEFERTVMRLDRSIDRERPCCENLATIHVGAGPHGAALRCSSCGQHRGWLPKEAIEFVKQVTERFGALGQPITLGDQTVGDQILKKFDDTNRGVLFKNDRKQSEKHADYKGEMNVNGTEFWLDAWIRESKKGTKFMSLSVKPKEETGDKIQPATKELNDDLSWLP
jgi:hypothetical protein